MKVPLKLHHAMSVLFMYLPKPMPSEVLFRTLTSNWTRSLMTSYHALRVDPLGV